MSTNDQANAITTRSAPPGEVGQVVSALGNELKTSSVPRRRHDLTVHELDGEALIFDAKSADTHRLNMTACFIWRLCDGRHEPREIAETLTRHFDVDFDEALEHTERMLDEFTGRQLLAENELVPGAARSAGGDPAEDGQRGDR